VRVNTLKIAGQKKAFCFHHVIDATIEIFRMQQGLIQLNAFYITTKLSCWSHFWTLVQDYGAVLIKVSRSHTDLDLVWALPV
jgi:hypothetical protein